MNRPLIVVLVSALVIVGGCPHNEYQIEMSTEGLADYCLWYESLTEKEAQAWDGFVAGLRPDEELIGRLKAVRLSGEAPPDKEFDYGRDAASRILQALEHEPR